MSVVFRSRQKYLSVAHEELFHVGVQPFCKNDKGEWIGSQEELEERQKLPDPDMVNSSYCFREGVNHNELTLEREDAIEAMRAFAKGKSYLIVELDADGNEPADPEGTPFIARERGFMLYPAQYKGYSTAEGKVFCFNMGTEGNMYITSDSDEIAIIRGYIKVTANCRISDPTYQPPFAEE